METLLVTNAVGKAQRVLRDGRYWWVAPATLIVPGVLAGSDGALLYPPEEVSANVGAWDGMPLTAGHPSDPATKLGTSAHTPGTLDRIGLGHVQGTRFDRKLVSEAWFDEERCNRVDPRIVGNLKDGKPIGLSTGLGTRKEDSSGVHHTQNGPRPYTRVARDYRPDHVAVLLDETGACSIADGCGILINSEGKPVATVGTVNTNQSVSVVSDPTKPTEQALNGWFSQLKSWLGVGGQVVKNAAPDPRIGKPLRNKLAPPTGNADTSLNERIEEVREAFNKRFPVTYGPDGMMRSCPTVDAVYDDYLIYCDGGETYRLGYSRDESGEVTLDATPQEVEEVVTYRPVGEPATMNTSPATLSIQPTDPITRGGDSMAMSAAEKAQKVAFLTANCDCWKGVPAATLNALPDGVLEREYAAAQPKPAVPPATAPVANTTTPAVPVPAPAPTVNSATPMTAEQWLATAPPEIAAVVQNGREIVDRERQAIIGRLTANIADEAQKQRHATWLGTKDVKELRAFLELMAPTLGTQNALQPPGPPQPLYTGQGYPGYVQNRVRPDEDVDDEPLEPPTTNWRELAEENAGRR
jgi:hypothetical protein